VGQWDNESICPDGVERLRIKAEWPGIATAVGIVLILALIIVGSRDDFHLKDWQTLIAAGVAGVGVIVAARNVTRQIRIGILGREEDRIERELPGLRDARYFCSGFLTFRVTQSFYGITDAFAKEGFGLQGSTQTEEILKALPNTDQATRHIVQTRLLRCFRMAFYAEGAMNATKTLTDRIGDPSQWAHGELDKVHEQIHQMRERFNDMRERFSKAMDQLEEAIRSFDRKIELYEARSARIRKEIEAYFDEEK
jgi:hypothetical protein